MRKFTHCLFTLIALFAIAATASAQNRIKLLRYDDDFSALKNDSLKKTAFDHLKYIPLGKDNYISFGGELREQMQVFDNINFGDVPATFADHSTQQFNHRLLLHTNIELGQHFRAFIQLNNTTRFLNDNPLVAEVDKNELSLHQAFGELKLKKWNFRLGRQELLYGSQRMITVREGPNTHLTFDGVVVKNISKRGTRDFFFLSKVFSKPYVFDDENFKETMFGVYEKINFGKAKLTVDYYSLNFQSHQRKYNFVPGYETRQTYGLRMYSQFRTLNFEVEGAYQSGKFNDLKISAYSVTGDVNVTLCPKKNTIIGFTANVASGDKDPNDQKLNTYNLLYSRPSYGLAAPIGNTNVISFSPYVKINPVKKLSVLAQTFFLARYSNADGTYSPAMVQSRPHATVPHTSRRDLGDFYIFESAWQQNEYLSFSFDASYFKAGSYPKATGNGKDITYLSFKTALKF